jgi:cyclopropane fatty-acyl-phospholipid synthase-like methyltransferase
LLKNTLRGIRYVIRARRQGAKIYLLRSGRLYFSGSGVGGMWDELGRLQFDFMVEQGLRPEHRLLDIGCGSLRGGVHFIRYLESGNYYGVDKQAWLLDAAVKIEIPRHHLQDKSVHLLQRDDFDFSSFGVEFDTMLAQSVFTHLPWNVILRCLVNVEKTLAPEGQFFATFFEASEPRHRIEAITQEPGRIVTYPDRNPYHYEFDVFAEMARRVGLRARYIGDWDHPRNQKMMVFTKAG